MTKEQLESYINQDLSSYDISKLTGKSQTTIRYWLKKFNLKTNFQCFYNKRNPNLKLKTRQKPFIKIDVEKEYNWQLIQQTYNEGKSWRELRQIFNISMAKLNFARKNGFFKSRKPRETLKLKNFKPAPMSQQTRQKLSESRKNYLAKNNLHRWHNKSSYHSSWFCESVKQELINRNIKFEEEYMPLKEINRFFAIDISLPKEKIGFELNGRQHYDSKGNLLPYYQKRHDLIIQNGWDLYEIKYNQNIISICDFIQKIIDSKCKRTE